MFRRLFSSIVFLVSVFLSVFSHADDLGQHILDAIRAEKTPTDASLLLMTRDLKWYEQNMQYLPERYRVRVEKLRIEMAGRSARSAAMRMGEPDAIFGATGSWKPGRDMDMVYFGKRIEEARAKVNQAFEEVTSAIIAKNIAGDEILASARNLQVPRKLSMDTMSLVVSDVPDFGYKDLERMYLGIRDALVRGESPASVQKKLHEDLWTALGKNFEAHIASTSPDMYRGAAGQEWWSRMYLENPEKMRTFLFNREQGAWVLKPGGLAAVPREIAERAGFSAFKGKGNLIFSKTASDFAMFFKHEKGGLSDTAKYMHRIYQDLDPAIIAKSLNKDNLRPFLVANAIAKDPERLKQLLQETGLTEEAIRKSLSELLYHWTETQMVLDAEKLVNELSSHLLTSPPDNADDVIGDLVAKARLKFDLNEMSSGLDILRDVPDEAQKRFITTLEAKFGESDAGKITIRYIKKQMRLLADEGGEITLRVLRILKDLRRIDDEQYQAALALFEKEGKLPAEVAASVKKARKEIMLISSAGMFDVVDDPQALERLMEAWRQQTSGALIQSPSTDLALFRKEFRDLPESDLLRRGWSPDELRVHRSVRQKLPGGAKQLAQLESRLGAQLAKSGLSVRQFQSKLHEFIFSRDWAQLGDAGSDIGALDAFVGVATGLYMTYDIMFNRNLSPEEENLELGNAWVTALPVVGDFAQGLITGGQAWYEGDKGKALEAGLWISIGIMGCVPGGQLPAVIIGISLAAKPLAAGVYDAREAQNLVQAWVESGDWAMDQKPRKLKGLLDREGSLHALTYDDLLTSKGDKPYKSAKADGLLGKGVTINDSIRGYAEKYVMPQYKAMADLRDALKSLYPDFSDKEWEDEFTAKYKIEVRGGKGGLALFRAYALVRTKALDQTVMQLKNWAEDEVRAARDYDAEVARMKMELQALQDELKCTVLIRHAEESVEAYSRIIKNVWEQESLPLSKLRIYEHYLKAYQNMAGKLRRVGDLFRECSVPYIPSSWHLTGFPELDADRVNTLFANMENGRKGAIIHLERLLDEFDQPVTKFDPGNECHKKCFDILAPLRYKVSFIENLSIYYKQLAEGESVWAGAYDSAVQRYTQQRDSLTALSGPSLLGEAESVAFQDALMTFVAAIPYALASSEADLYRKTAKDYEIRLISAQEEFDRATWMAGSGGKALESCLLAALKIELSLSDETPEEGTEITAKVKLVGGTLPSENSWFWKATGGLIPSSRSGEEISLKADSKGIVTVALLDHLDPSRAKVLVSAIATVSPVNKGEEKDKAGEKKDGQQDGGETITGETFPNKATPENKERTEKNEESVSESVPAPVAQRVDAQSEWFGSGLAGGWKVGHNEARLWSAKMMREISAKSKNCRAQTVHGTVSAKLESSFLPRPEEIDAKLRGSVKGNGWYPEEESLEPFSIGNYKGKLITTTLKYKNGFGNPMAGYRDGTAHVHGYAIVLHESDRRMISINFSVYGGSCWDNSGKANAMAQAKAGKAEAMAIIKGLTLHEKQQESSVTTGTPVVESGSETEKEEKKYQVTLTRVSPQTGPVTVGTPVTFKAALTGDKPEGELRFHFDPHPEVAFTPYDTAIGSTTAVFSNPGTTGVWVSAVDATGTIAKSDSLEIEILKPRLDLAFEPRAPMVGQEVKARLTVQPEVKEIDFRWMPVPGNAKHTMTSKDNREITFYLKDDKPAEIQVNARVPFSGEDLGEAKAAIAARKYAVKVSDPKAMGPPPQVWKEGVGLVTLEKAIAVDQIVEFSAGVEPAVLSGPIKYRWSAANGPCRVNNPSSSVARIIANAPGTCELVVTVRDRNDVQLGEGSGSFSASVTQEVVGQGRQKAQVAVDAKKLVQHAKDKVRKGDYDGAVKDAQDAARLDPKDTEATALAEKLRGDKERIDAQLAGKKALMAENRLAEAQKEASSAPSGQSSLTPLQAAESLWNEAKQLQKEQNYEAALEKYREGLRISPDAAVADRVKKLEKYVALIKGQARQKSGLAGQTTGRQDSSGTQQKTSGSPSAVLPQPGVKAGEASTVPNGWKPVTIGNVHFAVPSSWQHITREESEVEKLDLYWDGSFDAPLHGVSGGISMDYALAKKDLTGARSIRLGGVDVLRADDGPTINLLFPSVGGNRGVALLLFRGEKGSQATIDAVLQTFSVGPGDKEAEASDVPDAS